MDVFIVGYVIELPMSISLFRPKTFIAKSSKSRANVNCLNSPLHVSCKLSFAWFDSSIIVGVLGMLVYKG